MEQLEFRRDYSALARSYTTLKYESELRSLLSGFYKQSLFDNFCKSELHQKISDDIFQNYEGEEVIKYALANSFDSESYVAAFEVRVNESRADFLAINGVSNCFELKSKIDTTNRLEKQAGSYNSVFEYNTIVIDEGHLKKVMALLPEHYGIWIFCNHQFSIARKALLNVSIDPEKQLTMLTKKELSRSFKLTSIREILDLYSPSEINEAFKLQLKSRYEKRWTFLKSNWDSIIPIDVQFFFNSNIEPKVIYY